MKIDLDKLEASLAKQEQYERGLNYNFAHAERLEILNQIPALIAELRELREDAARAVEARLTEKADLLDWIEQKIGNVYEGIETVRLHRDDATNSFIVAIGKDSLAGYGHSLVAALRAAKGGGK